MSIELGHVEAIFRYPVKSMRGESLEEAALGWHGVDGDRRYALRRVDERGGMPWLTASKLPELVCFTPQPPDHVLTPEGVTLPMFGAELADDVARRYGAPVEMMQLGHGIFDETPVSVIADGTIAEICRLAGVRADARRFRPNILVRSARPVAFEEDAWVGGVLAFGDAPDAPLVSVTMRDLRCAMLNYDPDDARSSPEVMKVAVRANDNHAGVYGVVTRTGRVAVGQAITLHRAP